MAKPSIDSQSAEKLFLAASKAHEAGHWEEAEAICRVLAAANPKDAPSRYLLGLVLHQIRREEEAAQWLKAAAKLQPMHADTHTALGCVYHRLGDYPQAIASFARSTFLDPQRADTYYSLGNARFKNGEIEQALECYRQAVKLNPGDYESWQNIGKSLRSLNHLPGAIEAYERALAIKPDFHLARYSRAIALLLSERLEEGWREYEIRWKTLPPRPYAQPHWQGQSIPGQTLFLHAEQGFGDAIQFLRFIPQAKARAGRVILECRPELKRLFTASAVADTVIAVGEPLPAFDYYSSLVSLPHVLGTNWETIPRQSPYLSAPRKDDLPPAPAGHLRAGLVWAGNPTHHDDAVRSLRLEDLAPVLQTPGVTFYSLQARVPDRDHKFFERIPNLVRFASHTWDYLDTAQIIQKLDLVIAVDTSVAHLAGALGKPVWTFIQFAPDWRWFLNRPDTVWYPTMRLFRQKQPGPWTPVIQQVAYELRQLADVKR